jgi:hypothetical protein
VPPMLAAADAPAKEWRGSAVAVILVF